MNSLTNKAKLFLMVCMAIVISLTLSFSMNAAEKDYGSTAFKYLKYFDENHPQRVARTDGELEMANYLQSELKKLDYAPEVQDFTYSYGGTQNSQNIIAVKKGTSNKQIIVGAHYDSVKAANGTGDNASGVSVVLENAIAMKNIKTEFTIVYVFFGAEEVGKKGSIAYVNEMSQEEKDNTVLMINLDSVMAGTYTYAYGGTLNADKKPIDTWGVEQAFKLSDELKLGLRDNNTELNKSYPTPTTGTWSDHDAFAKAGITHVYLEASNWEMLDNPGAPSLGSSGAYETELGPVMHRAGKDTFEYITSTWPERSKHNIATYSKFLENYLVRVHPDGLKKAALPKYKTTVSGNKTYYYVLKNDTYQNYKTVVKTKNTVTTYNYIYTPKKVKATANRLTYKGKKVTKKHYYTFNKNDKMVTSKLYVLNKNNKFINTYNAKYSYYKNKKVNTKLAIYKNLNNKHTKKVKSKYTVKGIIKSKILLKYKNGKINLRYGYTYNKIGKLVSNKKYGNAKLYKTFYNKKGKAIKSYKSTYTSKGKIGKVTKIKIISGF